MRILTLLVLWLVPGLVLVPAARAATPPPRADRVDAVLLSSESPETLRDRLADLAASAPTPRVAVQAVYLRGMSFERAAMPDSAIACYRRAAAGRYPAALSALIDALLRRRATGDVDEAIKTLEQMQSAETETGVQTAHGDPARLGWAYVLAGKPKQGLALLAPLEAGLSADPVWRYRLARTFLDAGNATRASYYLEALNATARGQDHEVASLLKRLDKQFGQNAHIQDRTQQALQDHDDREIALLNRLKGRRVRLLASDGAYIGAALFADTTLKRPVKAAVVLAGLGDDLHDYDSLTVALRSSGFAVFVIDPRGSGWSVAPEFSLPDTWEGRQDALGARVSRDVRDGLNAFARVAKIDTSRVLLVGVGSMAPVAIAAAANDARIGTLALLDPWASPVERGRTLARARLAAVPTYLQLSVPGRAEAVFADTLFHTFPPKASRIVESTALGSGAAAFGSRPDVTPRFVRWLDETWAVKPAKRVIPRSTPRPG